MRKKWKLTDFIFLGSEITADGDCSHEIKRCSFLGRKAMTNLDSILKSRDINLLTKICLVRATGFPVVMYRCESWTIKKAECRRIDDFKLWCLRRLLRVPWTARRSNQSILKEAVLNIHWKDWWWSWSSNTLATWCEELTHWKRPWCWERLRAEGEGGNREWDGWMASPTRWTWVWASSRRWWRREAWCAAVREVVESDMTLVTGQQQQWWSRETKKFENCWSCGQGYQRVLRRGNQLDMSEKGQKGKGTRVKKEGVVGRWGWRERETRHAGIWREEYFRQRRTGRLSRYEIKDRTRITAMEIEWS